MRVPAAMRNQTVKRIAAWACLTAGMAGILLPLLPGIPLLLLGLKLLGPDHPLARPLVRWMRRN